MASSIKCPYELDKKDCRRQQCVSEHASEGSAEEKELVLLKDEKVEI